MLTQSDYPGGWAVLPTWVGCAAWERFVDHGRLKNFPPWQVRYFPSRGGIAPRLTQVFPMDGCSVAPPVGTLLCDRGFHPLNRLMTRPNYPGGQTELPTWIGCAAQAQPVGHDFLKNFPL